jgi:PhzF family phenazine biosynthesis protein
MPFAGHPTIGSAHAVLRRGLKPRIPGRLVQECGKGLVDIKIDGERLLLALPEPEFREPTKSHLTSIADGLGVSTVDVQRQAIIDVGPVWFTVPLASGDAVRALAPDMGLRRDMTSSARANNAGGMGEAERLGPPPGRHPFMLRRTEDIVARRKVA